MRAKLNALLNNPTIRRGGFAIAARFLGVFLNYVVSIVITRSLAINEAGVVFLLMTLVTGIGLFSRFGMEQLIVNDVAKRSEQGREKGGTSAAQSTGEYQRAYSRRSLALVTLSSVLVVVAWVMVAPVLNILLFDQQVDVTALRIAGIGILGYNWLMLMSAYMKALHKAVWAVLSANSLPAVVMLIVFLAAYDSFVVAPGSLFLYAAAMILSGMLMVAWVAYYGPGPKGWWPKKLAIADLPTKQQMIKRAIPLSMVSISSFLMLFLDGIMVARFLPNSDVALYSVASRLSFIALFFLAGLEATLYPKYVQMSAATGRMNKRFFGRSTGAVIMVLVLVSLVITLAGELLLQLFSAEYTAAKSTLDMLIWAQCLRGISLTFSFMFIITHRVKVLNSILFFALLLNFVANWWLIPLYGTEGAALATMLANGTLSFGVVMALWWHRAGLFESTASVDDAEGAQ